MKKKTKYMDTDIIRAMRNILDDAGFYTTGFDDVVKTLRESASKQERTDRIFIWLCSTHGEWCLNEEAVFIRGSQAHSVFMHFENQTGILAFVVEVKQFYNGSIIIGNLYNVGHKELCERVKMAAVPAGDTVIRYERGQRFKSCFTDLDTRRDEELGQFVSFQVLPESPELLEGVLINEKRYRNSFHEEYEITGYELYEFPESPKDYGKYYGKNPLLAQAETVVKNAKESGKQLFIRAVCSDGKVRYI